MIRKFLISLAIVLGLGWGGGPAFAAEWRAPGADARCPVCGMFVASYHNWTASIILKDGARVFFDGPKDMFRYFFDLNKYRPGAGPEAVEEIFVTEYYTVQPVPARQVYFINGSDVLGPMGKELVPVKGLEPARAFLRDHGGVKLLRFDGQALIEVDIQQ